MPTRRITVEELDELLVVLQDEDNWAIGPLDRRMLSFCVQLVRSTLVTPEANPVFDLDTTEEHIEEEVF